jgi:hypothetical protein
VTSEISVATTIRRPRQEVATVMFNPYYAPAWMAGVRAAEGRSGQPPEQGATFALIGGRAPLRRSEEFEIVEHEADQFLTLRAPTRMFEFELEGTTAGTLVWLHWSDESARDVPLLSALTQLRRRRAEIRALRRLKHFVESGAYRTWRAPGDARR